MQKNSTFWLDPESSKEFKAAPASLLSPFISLLALQTRLRLKQATLSVAPFRSFALRSPAEANPLLSEASTKALKMVSAPSEAFAKPSKMVSAPSEAFTKVSKMVSASLGSLHQALKNGFRILGSLHQDLENGFRALGNLSSGRFGGAGRAEDWPRLVSVKRATGMERQEGAAGSSAV